MRLSMGRVVVAAAVLAGSAGLAHGQRAPRCGDLWLERNQIYKDAGYCFRTRAAIAYFGNAGCMYDRQSDVPLSQTQRRIIADIVRLERNLGCGND